MSRTDELLARAWRRVREANEDGATAQTEKFLEDALAAALEHDAVLIRLAAHLRFALPAGRPILSTQVVGDLGQRPDITLTWPDGRRLELELKIGAPPGEAQIDQYLSAVSHVAAVARVPAARHPRSPFRSQFLGVFTWRGLREIAIDDPPVAWRQLLHLIDATGVAMPQIDLSSLTGLMSSWGTWETLDEWSWRATDAVQHVLNGIDARWVFRERKFRIADQARHRRYAYEAWVPDDYDANHLSIYSGMYLGRPSTCVDGSPDLYLTLHVNPAGPVGQAIRTDAAFQAAAQRWCARGNPVTREFNTDPGTWEFLRARQSLLQLLFEPDQGAFFVDWMKQRAQEWAEDGVLQRLTELSGGMVKSPPPPVVVVSNP